MKNITIVQELEGFRGDACLVRDQDDNYFVVSTISRDEYPHAFGDTETMAFSSDQHGNVLDWMEVAGGGNMSRDDVIGCLSRGEAYDWEVPEFDGDQDFDSEWYPSEDWEDWQREDASLGQTEE